MEDALEGGMAGQSSWSMVPLKSLSNDLLKVLVLNMMHFNALLKYSDNYVLTIIICRIAKHVSKTATSQDGP